MALIALTVVILIAAGFNFSANLFLSRIDILTQYLPWYSYLGERLRAGDLPGWLPYSMAGAPFAGDPQSGWGYIPAMFIFTLLPGVAGFKTLILFHLLLGAVATYLYARMIRLSVAGALVAALAFTLPGMIERSRCCTIHVEVAVWIPVAFLGIELAARERAWANRAVWWTLTGVAASQMIAGWIGQGAAYGLLTVAAYAAYRGGTHTIAGAADWRTRIRWLIAGGAVVVGLALLLAATAIIPRLDVVDRSNLAGGSYEDVGESAAQTGGWSVPILIDRLVTHDDRAGRWYAGGATLALAITAPFLAWRRYRLSFFVPFGLVVLILTLNETPVHRLFYLIPSFQQFHDHRPDRVLTVFPLVPAILAGVVVNVLPEWRAPYRRITALAAVPLAGAVLFRFWHPAVTAPMTWATLGAIAVVCIALALALALPDRRAIPIAIVVLALAVIWDPIGRQVMWWNHDTAPHRNELVRAYQHDDAAGAFLQERAEGGEVFRFLGYDPERLHWAGQQRTYHVRYQEEMTVALLALNRGIGLGLEDVQGYNPIQVKRYADFVATLNGTEQSYHSANVLYRGIYSPLLNLLNVRYIVVPREVPAGRLDLLHLSQRYPTVYADDRVRVIEKADSLPRVWIVHAARLETDARALDLLANEVVDPQREAILPPDTVPPNLTQPDDPAAERAVIAGRTPDWIALEVDLESPGLVVLSEIWDPGWEVRIDGRPAEMLRANTILRAVAVPAGSHRIELHYSSGHLVASAAVSGATWFMVLAGGSAMLFGRHGPWLYRRARRDRQAESSPSARAPARARLLSVRPLVGAVGASVERGDRRREPNLSEPVLMVDGHHEDDRPAKAAPVES